MPIFFSILFTDCGAPFSNCRNEKYVLTKCLNNKGLFKIGSFLGIILLRAIFYNMAHLPRFVPQWVLLPSWFPSHADSRNKGIIKSPSSLNLCYLSNRRNERAACAEW